MSLRCLALAGAFAMLAVPLLAAEEDPGRSLYLQQCAACHGTEGEGASGPDLRDVAGRSAAASPDYAYSAALRRSGLSWDAATIGAFLEDPQAVIPGTRMADPATTPAQADLIAGFVEGLTMDASLRTRTDRSEALD